MLLCAVSVCCCALSGTALAYGEHMLLRDARCCARARCYVCGTEEAYGGAGCGREEEAAGAADAGAAEAGAVLPC
eukprot:1898557-Rhodomonas_salina.1